MNRGERQEESMVRHTAKKVFDYHNWYAPSVYMFPVGLIGGVFVPRNGWANAVGLVMLTVVSVWAGFLIVAGLRRLEEHRHRVR
jgi:uncharacterized membrane protein